MKKQEEVSIKLVLNNKNLRFKTGELMNVSIHAKCKNIGSLEGIQYKWYLYRDGLEKCVKVTSTGTVVVSIHPMYAGSLFRLKLVMTANKRMFALGENGMCMSWENAEFVSVSSIAHIEFTPTCEEQVVSVEWCDKNTDVFYRKKMKKGEKSDTGQQTFHLQGERFGVVFCMVDLFGYNGKEVVVHREVSGLDEQCTQMINKSIVVPVTEGRVGVSFGRNLLKLGLKSGESREVTAIMRIQESESSTGILGDFRCKFKVEGQDKVETMDSYPLQPVMVGSYNVMDNNYEPCKYTRIDVEYTSEKKPQQKMVYDEGVMLQAIPVHIIGGKSKTKITLKDYNTKKCPLSSDKHKKAIFDGGTPPLDVKDGKIELDLKYDYGKDLDDSNLIEAWENGDYLKVAEEAAKFDRILKLLDYFLLPFDVVQRHELQVATCRHNHILELNMIPDIIWSLHVGFGRAYPDYSKLKKPLYNPKKSIRAQKQAVADARDGLLQGLEFEVGLTAEYNDGQVVDMKNSFIKQVEDASQKVEEVMGWFKLDNFFNFKDKDAQEEFNKRVVSDNEAIQYTGRKPNSSKARPSKLPIPVFMNIDTPMLFVGGTWQYDVNSSNKLSRKGTIYLEADPLVKVKGGIDLIACSQYIPVVGQIITAIIKGKDVLERGVNILSNGKVDVSVDIWFNIYLEGTVNFKGELAISDDDKTVALKAEGTLMLGVELGIKCVVEVKTITIKSKSKTITTIRGEIGLEGKVETGFTITPSLGYSSKGVQVEVGAKFEGVILDVSGTAKIEKTENKKKQAKPKKGKPQVEKEQDGYSFGKKFGDSFELVKEADLGTLEFNFSLKSE